MERPLFCYPILPEELEWFDKPIDEESRAFIQDVDIRAWSVEPLSLGRSLIAWVSVNDGGPDCKIKTRNNVTGAHGEQEIEVPSIQEAIDYLGALAMIGLVGEGKCLN